MSTLGFTQPEKSLVLAQYNNYNATGPTYSWDLNDQIHTNVELLF